MGPVDLAVHMSRGAREFFPFPLFKRTDLFKLRFRKFSTLLEASDLLRLLVMFTMLWRYIAQSANEVHEAVSCLRAVCGPLCSLLGMVLLFNRTDLFNLRF